MSVGPDTIETTGDTVEEAIERGLQELGVDPLQVMIEVLEEPHGGAYGTDKRPARVRLQLIGGRVQMPPPAPEPPPEPRREREPQRDGERPPRSGRDGRDKTSAPQTPRAERAEAAPSETRERRERPERADRPPRQERPERHTPEKAARPDRRERGERPDRGDQSERREQPERIERDLPASALSLEKKPYFDLDVDDKDENLPILHAPDEVPESEQDDEAQVSKIVLNELLERMAVTARIVVRRATAGEQGGRSPWVLDVNGGRDLRRRLVGKRGDTLAALQYITRLVASRELQRRVDVVVDVESYKVERAATLHGLALRMADEALRTERTITLEPMPPHERRIIHLALRGRQDVVTRSIGEGSSRKVTIVPQSQQT